MADVEKYFVGIGAQRSVPPGLRHNSIIIRILELARSRKPIFGVQNSLTISVVQFEAFMPLKFACAT